MAGKSNAAVSAPIVEKEVEIAKVKIGRPTKYTPEVGDIICELLGNGQSLRQVAKYIDVEPRNIYQWLRVYPEFRHQYALSKEESADALAEKIQDVAESTLRGEYDPQAARVAIDAFKWTASKLKPKKYGDKLDLTSDGKALPQPLLSGVTSIQLDNDDTKKMLDS